MTAAVAGDVPEQLSGGRVDVADGKVTRVGLTRDPDAAGDADDRSADDDGPDDPRTTRRPPGEDVRPVGERVELTPPAEVARAALNRAKAAALARGFRPGQEPRRRDAARPAARLAGHRRPRPAARRGHPRRARPRPRLDRGRVGRAASSAAGATSSATQWPTTASPRRSRTACSPCAPTRRAGPRTSSCSCPQLLRRLADDVGEDVVRRSGCCGPAGPGFKRVPGGRCRGTRSARHLGIGRSVTRGGGRPPPGTTVEVIPGASGARELHASRTDPPSTPGRSRRVRHLEEHHSQWPKRAYPPRRHRTDPRRRRPRGGGRRVRRQQHHRPRGSGSGPQAARHVHRLDR